MSRLQLSFACGLYDRMLALYTGEVKPAGIDLNFIAIDQPRPIFDRMSGGQEFDVAEYSSSEFVQRFANRECPFVAIPVFPSIAFRMGFIAINRKSGIKTPKDLAGKRIGVPLYTMTAAIFINGILKNEFGVDLSNVRWLQSAMNTEGAHGSPTVLPLLKNVSIQHHGQNAWSAPRRGRNRCHARHQPAERDPHQGGRGAVVSELCRGRQGSLQARSIRSCIWSRSKRAFTSAIRSSPPVCTMLS
jgi:hypothetical protein